MNTNILFWIGVGFICLGIARLIVYMKRQRR